MTAEDDDRDGPVDPCRCARLYLGLRRTEVRDWRGGCPIHGYGTDYYERRCADDRTFARWTDPDRLPWY